MAGARVQPDWRPKRTRPHEGPHVAAMGEMAVFKPSTGAQGNPLACPLILDSWPPGWQGKKRLLWKSPSPLVP